jgi:hypothetical protein
MVVQAAFLLGFVVKSDPREAVMDKRMFNQVPLASRQSSAGLPSWIPFSGPLRIITH